MNNDIKCPFCQQKLDYDDLLCSCINEHCEESFDMVGTELLWQKVIDLKQELDHTRKALDVAKDTIRHADWFFDGDYNVDAKTMHNEIKYAIKAITALEQKE